jgi:hypothetical protein
MMNKFATKAALFFLLRFIVIFGLLIAPWPGWNQIYARYFQALGQMALGTPAGSKRVVIIGPASGKDPALDTRITLGNSTVSDGNGHGIACATEIPSRSIGWVPTALTLALVLATPIPWKRRLGALVGGLALIHLFIFLTLQSWIWNNLAGVSLATLSAFWQRAAYELNYALMTQLGASFTIPVVIWVLVTFRRQDANAD